MSRGEYRVTNTHTQTQWNTSGETKTANTNQHQYIVCTIYVLSFQIHGRCRCRPRLRWYGIIVSAPVHVQYTQHTQIEMTEPSAHVVLPLGNQNENSLRFWCFMLDIYIWGECVLYTHRVYNDDSGIIILAVRTSSTKYSFFFYFWQNRILCSTQHWALYTLLRLCK